MLGVSRMKDTVKLVMIMCICVTFKNWFFPFEIQRFTWIYLWTSKEKQTLLPGPLKVTQRRPKIATFNNSKVTIQRFVDIYPSFISLVLAFCPLLSAFHFSFSPCVPPLSPCNSSLPCVPSLLPSISYHHLVYHPSCPVSLFITLCPLYLALHLFSSPYVTCISFHHLVPPLLPCILYYVLISTTLVTNITPPHLSRIIGIILFHKWSHIKDHNANIVLQILPAKVRDKLCELFGRVYCPFKGRASHLGHTFQLVFSTKV